MPRPKITAERATEAQGLVRQHGSIQAAARASGIPYGTLHRRFNAVPATPADPDELQDRVRELETALKSTRASTLDDEYVKRKIIGLSDKLVDPPEWTLRPVRGNALPGVPSAFWSDWHWGEVVDPNQIGGVNAYDLQTAHERARTLVEKTIYLLRNHVVHPKFPGIVVNLGGDMVSGEIHDELTQTNAMPIMPTVIDLYGVLRWSLRTLSDEFGRVFVPCVTGNHGRNTQKPRAKNRNYTNFDWLLYQFLVKSFDGDDRITFMIPDGPDALYRVYGHRYLLTHGDQFRGGDGQIGAIGPITRGNKRKLARNSAINREYDTMLLGHWHQYMPLHRQIVNGCFPAGSEVATPTGVKRIEEVAIGDRVISRDGTTQEVSHRFERVSSQGLVHLKVRGIESPLTATPNHLVWAIKSESKRCHSIGAKWDALRGNNDAPQWIPADFISPGDYVHIPRSIGTDRPVSEESAWAFGLYLAEGSTLLDGGRTRTHHRVCLTMHERELPVLRRFAIWFDKTFGVQSRVFMRTKRNGGKTAEFVASPGRDVCVSFRAAFGHLASGKRLPHDALQWAPTLGASLIRGWLDGDGHTTATGVTSGTTISRDLASGLFRLALNAGMTPSMSKLSAGGPRKSDSYSIHFNNGQESMVIGGELFYRVHARYRDAQVVPVFDLEVSGEHTYTVGHVGVHNSLKGYDEYANANNFEYEPPTQALWLTHPEHGITIQMPVYLATHAQRVASDEWVSWKST